MFARLVGEQPSIGNASIGRDGEGEREEKEKNGEAGCEPRPRAINDPPSSSADGSGNNGHCRRIRVSSAQLSRAETRSLVAKFN